MEKIVIKPYDPSQKEGTEPMSKAEVLALTRHLQPVIDCFVAQGNSPMYTPTSHHYKRSFEYIGNGWVQEGTMTRDSIFRFRRPVNAEEVRRRFEFPESIVLFEDPTRIVDRSIHAKIVF